MKKQWDEANYETLNLAETKGGLSSMINRYQNRMLDFNDVHQVINNILPPQDNFSSLQIDKIQ